MRRFALAVTLGASALALAGCKHSAPANVAATVNSRPVTYADIDRQFQFQFAGGQERPQDDQLTIQRIEILRGLIDNEILLQRAEKLGLMATDADVEQKYNELKSPYTQEDFQKQLTARKMSAEDLRAQVRRDLSVQKLINKEITSHIAVTDKDVADFYNGNKQTFNLPEPHVHLAQIVVTGQPDPNVKNLKNDKAQNDDQARKKIQALEARLRQGEDFAMLAQNFSEDPKSLANGGDLGFISESALEETDPELRKYIAQMPPGQISRIIRMGPQYRILKVISKEPAGQRELNDPRVQQNIREILINRKDQLLKAAYYEVARNEAKVENYYARAVVEKKDSK